MFVLKLSLLIALSVVNAVDFTPFLSNGDDAQIAEFPFIVSFQEINVHIGSGSLLNEKWILSSARLFTRRRITDLNIEYGNTVITPGPNGENNARISQLILHEDYGVPTPLANDISLIESDTSINIALHQPFAKLAIPGRFQFLSGTKSVYAGWGHIAAGTIRTNRLQKADLQIMSFEECVVAVEDTQAPNKENICAIGESVMCTGKFSTYNILYFFRNNLKITGDLGGPLIVNGVVVGVASFRSGPTCESVAGKFPNVYTSVSHYVRFLLNFILTFYYIIFLHFRLIGLKITLALIIN
jgi:secreted trypsin-like serine protease